MHTKAQSFGNSFKMLPRPGCNRHHYNDELHLFTGCRFGAGGALQHIISSFLDLRPTDPKCPAISEVVSNHKNYHEAKLFLDRNEALLYTNTNFVSSIVGQSIPHIPQTVVFIPCRRYNNIFNTRTVAKSYLAE